MTEREVIRTGLIIFILGIFMTVGTFLIFEAWKPQDCWSKYQTEDEAIYHCENHNNH